MSVFSVSTNGGTCVRSDEALHPRTLPSLARESLVSLCREGKIGTSSHRHTEQPARSLQALLPRTMRGIAAGVIGALFALVGRCAFHRDELHFIAVRGRPARSHVDQPSLISFLARFGDLLPGTVTRTPSRACLPWMQPLPWWSRRWWPADSATRDLAKGFGRVLGGSLRSRSPSRPSQGLQHSAL